MATITSPSGRTYEWTKDTPPTEADFQAIKQYDESLGGEKQTYGGLTEEEIASYPADVSQAGIAQEAISEAPGGGVSPGATPEVNRQAFLKNAVIGGTLGAIAAPMAAVEALPALAPATAQSLAGYLGRSAAINAISGAAGGIVSEGAKLAAGEQTLGKAAGNVLKDTLAAGAMFPLNPVIEKAIGTAIGAATALGKAGREALSLQFGEAAKTVGKGALLGAVRPLYSVPRDEVAANARAAIEEATGVKVPASVGEEMGLPYAKIESELGAKATGTMSDESRDEIAKRVAYAATQLAGPGASVDDVAEVVAGQLRSKIGEVSEPAKAEIERFARAATKAVNDKLDAFGPAARDAFGFSGTPATAYEAGSAGKQFAEKAVDAFKEAENRLYSAARAGVPKDFQVTPKDMAPLRRVRREILGETVQSEREVEKVAYDAYGNPVASTEVKRQAIPSAVQDSGAKTFLDQVEQFASSPQTLDSVRQFRTSVSDAISDRGMLAGIGDANKKRIARAAYDAIENAMDRLPDSATKEAFKYANKHRFENIDMFKSGVSQGAATAFEEGGSASQTLFNQLKGNVDAYKTFKRTLQGTPETADLWPNYEITLRDAIVTDAFEAAKVPGETRVSVGKFLSRVQQVKPEILKDLGINLEPAQRMAAAEATGERLLGSMPKDAAKTIEWVDATEAELGAFLETGDRKILDSARQRAAAEADLFKNRAMAEAAKGQARSIEQSPNDFLKGVLSGRYTAQETSQLMDALRDNPTAREGVQRLFLEKALAESTRKAAKGGYAVDAERLGNLIAPVSGGEIPSSGGKLASTAEGILGKSKLDDLRKQVSNLSVTQRGAFPKANPVDTGLLDAVLGSEGEIAAAHQAARKAGLILPLRTVSTIWNGIRGGYRYRVASYLFNNDTTRPLLGKPISSLTGADASEIEQVVKQAISEPSQ